ncbi:ATPase WRNIP1-like [Anopheles maculipalpis]|uniref:ATPase WRNIP1-like n=1 Tax=Anopheles maculipalpis TaxID=1496333 RepID=UPI00215931BD|nr:ATPase WRNIP1-like [Anopheles maculipalpis]
MAYVSSQEEVADMQQPSTSIPKTVCPVCDKWFPKVLIEEHVDECLNRSELTEEQQETTSSCVSEASGSKTPTTESRSRQPVDGRAKRNFSIFDRSPKPAKRSREDDAAPLTVLSSVIDINSDVEDEQPTNEQNTKKSKNDSTAQVNVAKKPLPPLAELMRPTEIENYVGQDQIVGQNTMLRKLLDSGTIPSLILWGPPGCGKTTLANIIASRCKRETATLKFVKLSATMAGVAEVKEVVKTAKNDLKYNRRTLLFMDEIHRFNKLQQDIFLPHVEAGTITLIGATTENPSFSLNSALLSRCRVIVLVKHTVESMMQILTRALPEYETVMIPECVNNNVDKVPDFSKLPFIPRTIIHEDTVRWLAETCDGDARIGLNGLQLALSSVVGDVQSNGGSSSPYDPPKTVTLQDVREGIKKSHLLYDRKGDQHYDIISALHKSIRASDDNAALYWATRMIASGEDPRYICRRMIRMASEDIGLADTNALQVATATLAAVQSVGLPEADCIIAHCAVYLARAPKSRALYDAYRRCRASIDGWKKGPMPGVPLHLRNAPTKLMKDLHYGAGYNMLHKDQSGLSYMPEGLEDESYFSE